MKKIGIRIGLAIFSLAVLSLASCSKSDSKSTAVPAADEGQVLSDFVNKLVLPQYQNLQDKATALNTAVNTLNTTTNDANLAAARTAWMDTRQAWEQCEGFLLGPVEDDNYDPQMDTWPVDHTELDSLIGSADSLNLSDIQTLPTYSLRGFHPLEYVLWGQNGTATAASITDREKKYMVSLAADIVNITTSLNTSWKTTGGNYQDKIINPSTNVNPYHKRSEVFLAISRAIADICDEVSNSKMAPPFTAHDSTQTESPFSHSSMTDFRNNIIGAQNTYFCTYGGQTGASLHNIIGATNLSLDIRVQQEFTNAIAALNNVTTTFELAIYTQRTQLQTAMTALATLNNTMTTDVATCILNNVKD